MRLGVVGYYLEFVLYPVLAALLAAYVASRMPRLDWPAWVFVALIGGLLWTLVEYAMHRFVFHRVPWLRDLHAEHHDDHAAPLGTPPWISLPAMGVAAAGVIAAAGFVAGSALVMGLMLGYWWYISVHHVVHHWRLPDHGYAFRLKRRHALHHHHDEHSNFGVTCGVWDVVFGTAETTRQRHRAQAS